MSLHHPKMTVSKGDSLSVGLITPQVSWAGRPREGAGTPRDIITPPSYRVVSSQLKGGDPRL